MRTSTTLFIRSPTLLLLLVLSRLVAQPRSASSLIAVSTASGVAPPPMPSPHATASETEPDRDDVRAVRRKGIGITHSSDVDSSSSAIFNGSSKAAGAGAAETRSVAEAFHADAHPVDYHPSSNNDEDAAISTLPLSSAAFIRDWIQRPSTVCLTPELWESAAAVRHELHHQEGERREVHPMSSTVAGVDAKHQQHQQRHQLGTDDHEGPPSSAAFTVFTIADMRNEKWQLALRRNRACYCVRHRCAYCEFPHKLDPGRPASWSKNPAFYAIKHLSTLSVGLDADAVIMNHDISFLHDIAAVHNMTKPTPVLHTGSQPGAVDVSSLRKDDDKSDSQAVVSSSSSTAAHRDWRGVSMLFTSDFRDAKRDATNGSQSLNAGVFLWKNTADTLRILRDVYRANETVVKHQWWEQKAFMNFLAKNPRYLDEGVVRIIPWNKMNSPPALYEPGDFIKHHVISHIKPANVAGLIDDLEWGSCPRFRSEDDKERRHGGVAYINKYTVSSAHNISNNRSPATSPSPPLIIHLPLSNNIAPEVKPGLSSLTGNDTPKTAYDANRTRVHIINDQSTLTAAVQKPFMRGSNFTASNITSSIQYSSVHTPRAETALANFIDSAPADDVLAEQSSSIMYGAVQFTNKSTKNVVSIDSSNARLKYDGDNTTADDSSTLDAQHYRVTTASQLSSLPMKDAGAHGHSWQSTVSVPLSDTDDDGYDRSLTDMQRQIDSSIGSIAGGQKMDPVHYTIEIQGIAIDPVPLINSSSITSQLPESKSSQTKATAGYSQHVNEESPISDTKSSATVDDSAVAVNNYDANSILIADDETPPRNQHPSAILVHEISQNTIMLEHEIRTLRLLALLKISSVSFIAGIILLLCYSQYQKLFATFSNFRLLAFARQYAARFSSSRSTARRRRYRHGSIRKMTPVSKMV